MTARPTTRGVRLWLLDHGALWSVRIGDALAGPFYRLERRLTQRWLDQIEAELPPRRRQP